MQKFYRFCRRLVAAPTKVLFNFKVSGQENEPGQNGGGYLVCANHMSNWDPIWLGVAFRNRQLHYMAKAELFKIPLLRRIISALGTYPVNRGYADLSSIRATVSILRQGKCVCMFPQGTRYKGINPLDTEVKSGIGMLAIRAGVDVLPVFIKTKNYNSAAFRRKNIIIGKPISNTILTQMRKENAGYKDISNFIFKEICALDGVELQKEKGSDES